MRPNGSIWNRGSRNFQIISSRKDAILESGVSKRKEKYFQRTIGIIKSYLTQTLDLDNTVFKESEFTIYEIR